MACNTWYCRLWRWWGFRPQHVLLSCDALASVRWLSTVQKAMLSSYNFSLKMEAAGLFETLIKTHKLILPYPMEQIPSWEVRRFSARQVIPRILWKPKVHYCIHKCPPPVLIVSQLDPVHAHTSHFLKIPLNIIPTRTPGSSKWSSSLKFLHRNPVHTSPLPHMCYTPCPSYSRFDHLVNFGWGIQIMKFLIM